MSETNPDTMTDTIMKKQETPHYRILVVDDEDSARRTLSICLRKETFVVETASSAKEAFLALERDHYDIVVTDLCLEESSGLEIVKTVRKSFPATESIVITAHSSLENAVAAVHAGAFDFVAKPFTLDQVLVKVRKAIEHKEMRAELTSLRQHVAMSYGFDNIVGISDAITALKQTARRIAPTDITVLISGPSGTGKELFARAIHYHSSRSHRNLVTIDCSAIPESLMESELFGHKKGSFTSATVDKSGLLEAADGGTVFLDEVSNMPLPLQSKLLRFIQNSEFRPVGADETRRVDVRIIAATNRDLGEMVAAGEFREDLYYRLNVIPLNLPSLSQRPEDIEVLVDYFTHQITARMGRPAPIVSRDAVDKLRSHNWPGNVRELENTLKRAIALIHSDTIDSDDIVFIGAEHPTPSTKAVDTNQETPDSNQTGLLDQNQRTVIIRALDENNWNFTQTAQELGIGRTTLWRKVKKFNLKRKEDVVT